MLAIRMQRTGRKGHAQFRIIVQDARRTPTSGSIVAQLGYYNPHGKQTVLDKEKTDFYLEHGAQPSGRVASLLKQEGIKLPAWVQAIPAKSGVTRHPEKLRKNRPADVKEPEAAAPPETSVESEAESTETMETPTEETAQTDAEESSTAADEEPAADAAENKE